MTTLPHVKLTANGYLGATPGLEIWSMTSKVGIASSGSLVAPTEADLAALVTPAQNAWTAFVTSPHLLYQYVVMTHLTLTAIGADGNKIPSVDSVIFDYGVGEKGAETVLPTNLVFQVAMCLTQRGATYTRGLASHGRFYAPLPVLDKSAAGTDSSMSLGTCTIQVCQKFANAAAALLTGLTTGASTPSGTAHAALISDTIATPRWQNVSSVQVDTRPDIIRRRGDQLSGSVGATVSVT